MIIPILIGVSIFALVACSNTTDEDDASSPPTDTPVPGNDDASSVLPPTATIIPTPGETPTTYPEDDDISFTPSPTDEPTVTETPVGDDDAYLTPSPTINPTMTPPLGDDDATFIISTTAPTEEPTATGIPTLTPSPTAIPTETPTPEVTPTPSFEEIVSSCGLCPEDDEELAAMQAFKDTIKQPYFRDVVDVQTGRPIFYPGEPYICMFEGDNNYYDPSTYTQCGVTYHNPEEFYKVRVDQQRCFTGKGVALGLTFIAFSYAGNVYDIPLDYLDAIHASGGTPVLKMLPMDWAWPSENLYPQAQVAQGIYDEEVLIPWLLALGSLDYPVAVTYAPEANGNWYPYSQDTPEDTRAAFEHLMNLAAEHNLNNLTFIYNPSVYDPYACSIGTGAMQCPIDVLDRYYPQGITTIGLDGYNWGGKTYSNVFRQSWDYLAGQHPESYLGVLEMGSAEDQTAWIPNAFETIRNDGGVISCYFNVDKELDWGIYRVYLSIRPDRGIISPEQIYALRMLSHLDR